MRNYIRFSLATAKRHAARFPRADIARRTIEIIVAVPVLRALDAATLQLKSKTTGFIINGTLGSQVELDSTMFALVYFFRVVVEREIYREHARMLSQSREIEWEALRRNILHYWRRAGGADAAPI